MQLCLANFFRALLQGDDGRRNVDGSLSQMEALDLGGDQGFRIDCLAAAFGKMRGGNLLQIVDVVDEDAFELAHLRIDVAGHGNVDEEHGAVAAAMQKGLPVLPTEDGLRRAGGADDDVSSLAAS